ncbi:MAG: HAD family hydrolase [Clostridiales bacterium]|nr:HAD family hydrolase [Clostridiales bacterium]
MANNNTLTKNIDRLSPNIELGLNDIEVSERYENGLVNKVKQKYSKSYINIFVNNVCTFFNLLGLIVFIALLLSGATLGNFFFVFFYIANISIGIIQEIRAKRCIDKLSLVASKTVKVIRNGQTIEIMSSDIVLDDIILLGIGNQIPTDCKILKGDIEVNESLLTGESVAVKKSVGDTLLAGSFITSGICTVQAIKVGKDNYVETLSEKAKAYKKPQSEIMSSLKLIIKVISCIIVPIATASILRSILIKGASLPASILGTSTIVIGMIPAGMFLLTSVALAVGIIKLAKHKTLVQDLYSLEMLARVDTICFDKTGTITDGKMTVINIDNLTDDNLDIKPIVSSMLNALQDNNQTAIAMLNYFGEQSHFTPIQTMPFSSKRKLSAVSFDKIGTFSFGAPEFVLDKAELDIYEDKINSYTKKGLRVLVFAKSNSPITEDQIPNDFKAISLIIIADNVREDAISTIQWFKDNNVQIKVISGDNAMTVAEVSKRVGIENADKYISLEGLTDEQVFDVANKYTVFGRVSPEQKAILVKALKSAGHVTAMTGDGVNDILALKEADCAVSVASGSDAARNVSHLVLLDNNFNSMPKVVHEGRRVINNVQSSASLFLMKTLFTMLWGIITLCLPYMNTYPYTLSNMIMFEVFIIGIPSFFLSFQPNDSRVDGHFISYIIKKSLPSALLMVLSVFIIELFRMPNPTLNKEIYDTMGIYVLTFAGVINLFITCKPLNKYRSIVFFSNLIIILIISSLAMTTDLGSYITLAKLLPLSKYYINLIIITLVVLADIPLAFILQKLFKNLDLSKKKVK